MKRVRSRPTKEVKSVAAEIPAIATLATDKKARAIKRYIDNMSEKAAIQTDNKRFESGKSSISTTKPPLGKKRKR